MRNTFGPKGFCSGSNTRAHAILMARVEGGIEPIKFKSEEEL
jgi:hypothetical protein